MRSEFRPLSYAVGITVGAVATHWLTGWFVFGFLAVVWIVFLVTNFSSKGKARGKAK